VKLKFNFEFEIPPEVYRLAAVVGIILLIIAAFNYSKGADTKGKVTLEGVEVEVTHPNREYVEVRPVKKDLPSGTPAGEAPTQGNEKKVEQGVAQNKKTHKNIRYALGYYWLLRSPQGDVSDDPPVVEKRKCVPGMPVCSLPQKERDKPENFVPEF